MAQTIDPVCGMKVDPEQSTSADHEGKTYYFCSFKCERRFKKNPGSYSLEEAEASREPGRGGSLADYLPLAVLIGFTLLAASALELRSAGWSWKERDSRSALRCRPWTRHRSAPC